MLTRVVYKYINISIKKKIKYILIEAKKKKKIQKYNNNTNTNDFYQSWATLDFTKITFTFRVV